MEDTYKCPECNNFMEEIEIKYIEENVYQKEVFCKDCNMTLIYFLAARELIEEDLEEQGAFE